MLAVAHTVSQAGSTGSTKPAKVDWPGTVDETGPVNKRDFHVFLADFADHPVSYQYSNCIPVE